MPKRTAQNLSPADGAGAIASVRDRATGGNVVVIATDSALLELLRGALRDRHRLWRAEHAAQAADLLLAAPSSVLLLDVAVTGQETAAIVGRLSEQFPGVPVIVTGRRDDEATLSSLISSGAIFRFLHKPLSEERARTFVEAGARRVADQPPPRPKPAAAPKPVAVPEPPPAPPAAANMAHPRAAVRPRRGPGRGLALAGLLLLAVAVAALLWLDGPWQARLRAVTGASPAAGTATAPRADPEVDRLLREAGFAMQDGRLAEPAGNNAIEAYRAALARDPGNVEALEGLSRTADQLLVEVEFALLDGNLAAAATALDAARAASPRHPRLDEFSTRLADERTKLVAPNRPAAAPTPAPAKAAARDALAGESERRTQFDRAMSNARAAIAAGQTAQAADWLARAAGLAVDPPAVQRLQAQLDAVRAATEREQHARLLALTNQRIAQGRLIEPDADSARHYLELLRASDPAFAGVTDTAALLGERLLGEAKRLAAEGRQAEAQRLFAAAAGYASAAQVRAAREESAAARGGPAGAVGVQPESTLARVAHTPPAYPERAAARGIEGWVDVEFTVGADGRPRDARVVNASPRGVFDSAALQAVERWRYQPPPGGEQRVGLRMKFTLGSR